ncbi:hypothetical protein [Pseudoalteromonas lipolytica]|uniref:Fibronectin type-III domain-containing protein n=1 Tax=Pseudoalteromonas lipolytica TaxID=570156 RepID=A0ABY1GWH2_9GAMM|nr:hypothetical protein [Pseudoalteromonas lipolytica]MBE0349654.1 hypothetical protein [Pseudoalteromonas lipolytica LMEB 39]SFU02503.1 hypothetical protein SAMN04487854_1313 [Pseudoalteromonas lipolytica]
MLTNKKTLLALSVASVFALSGCSSDDDKNKPDPIDPPVEVVVPPEAPIALGAVVNGNVVDAASTDVVASTIMFYENGAPSTNLVDLDGNKLTSLESDDGSFTFQLAEGSEATSVTAVVMADEYIQKTFTIDLSDLSEGDVQVELALVSENTEGVAKKNVDATVSGGSSADPITSGVADGKATAAVTVPANTTLLDAKGDPITGEKVTLKVTAADTSSSAGAAITPEGLNSEDAETVYTPVGVASVEMVDENGTKIKKFSQPITVSMAIPADKGFTTGDELTLVSQNEDTGVWTTETQKVEVKDLIADGSFYNASFMTDHLTFFSAVKGSSYCAAGIRVLFSGDEVPASGLFFRVASSDGAGTLFARGGTSTLNARYVSGVYDGATARVTVRDVEGNTWYDSVDEVSVCGDVNVSLSAPADVEYVSETLSLTAQCSNDSTATTAASGALVKYSLSGKSKKVARPGETAGTYTLDNLVSGQEYTVTVKYKDTLKSIGDKTYTITADGTDESQTEQLTCDTSTGVTGS